MHDPVGAFVPGITAEAEPLSAGVLSGLDFAIKDLFDVAGVATSYGHPEWARTHGLAMATAPVVLALLQAGARLRGKTKTVELAYGLTGENAWHGTPTNPAAPDRFPGGSSCGSAAAVAAGLVDFALGSDTGGSVRIPASYCGLFGIRPSYGVLSLAGACGLAPSFDTVGWFARDAATLERVGQVLLPGGATGGLSTLLKVEDAWMNAEPAVATALIPALEKLESACGRALTITLVPEGLEHLYHAFRCLQAQEAWATLGRWVEAVKPEFGPGVQQRFDAAKVQPIAAALHGRELRKLHQARMASLLGGGNVLVYPTSPCAAPKLDASADELQRVRDGTLGVTAITGMAGLCEVTIPVTRVGGAPVGLSLVAAHGRDRALLALTCRAAHIFGMDE